MAFWNMDPDQYANLRQSRTVLLILCSSLALVTYISRISISVLVLPMSLSGGWDEVDRGKVLAGFFYGYMLMQIPGGIISSRYGSKNTLTMAIVVSSVISFLLPMFASFGGVYIVALGRVGLGLFQAPIFPTLHKIVRRRMPLAKRSFASSVINGSTHLGSLVGVGAATSLLGIGVSWKVIQGSFALLAFAWVPFWVFLFRGNENEDDKSSSVGDGDESGEKGGRIESVIEEEAIPAEPSSLHPTEIADSVSSSDLPSYKACLMTFFTNRGALCLFAAAFGTAYTFYTVMSWLPSFYADHIGVDSSSSSSHFFLLLPYLAMGSGSVAAGALSTRLIESGRMSVRNVRIGMQFVGSGSFAVCLFIAASLTSPIRIVLLLGVGAFFGAWTVGGVTVNHMDVGGAATDIITGVANTFGTVGGILGVQLSALILKAYENSVKWHVVFLCCGLVSVGTACVFAWGAEVVSIDWKSIKIRESQERRFAAS